MSSLQHIHMLICLLIFATTSQLEAAGATTLDLQPIPQLCDSMHCPPEAEMTCPEDSVIREMLNAVDLIKSNAVTSAPVATTEKVAFNASLIPDELYAQCCLAKKCVCKTCYIPDCAPDSDEVVVELQPEAMDTPGQCCGEYQCLREPNCTEVRDTEFYWLQRCQRCHCTSGARICVQSCDEGAEEEKRNAICESKNLNSFFEDGESWKDGCYECECVKGEEKCVIPFCGHVNCPSQRQVMLKDSCCPICWPKGVPMPNEKQGGYDDGYGDYNEAAGSDIAAPTELLTTMHPAATSSSSGSSAELSVYVAPTSPKLHNAPPCQVEPHDFPEVVEVVHQPYNSNLTYPLIIGALVVVNVGLLLYIRHLRAKQRSYRPVSNFDDKV